VDLSCILVDQGRTSLINVIKELFTKVYRRGLTENMYKVDEILFCDAWRAVI